MLVYIHVPFCRTRCHYCAFHSVALGKNVAAASSPLVRDYVDGVLLEIARWADMYGDRTVQSVFFGGGTPSLLPPRIVGVILDRVARSFHLEDRAEVTLEANPESLRGDLQARQLLDAGVNRISIGIQTLDGDLLHTLGRPHKAQDSLNAVRVAREAGFANVGVDLMWGLPGQSVRQWLQTLKDVARLSPDHISAYGLTLEPGTAMEAACAEGRLHVPPEHDQNLMFMKGSSFLEEQGYIHYEISNFARMGYQCRHNMGYWEGAEYLGVGPSATSTIENFRWTNPADQNVWAEKIRSGDMGREREELKPMVRVLEMIMLGLRTSRGLELARYRALTGHDFLRDHGRLVQALHENGLVRIMNGWFRLTCRGMLVSNSILSNLFERTEKVLKEALPPEGAAMAQPAPTETVRGGPDVRKVVWPKA